MRPLAYFYAGSLIVLHLAGCGDDTGSSADLSMPSDMAHGPDLAMRLPDGVQCGTDVCTTPDVCCVHFSGGMVTSSMCHTNCPPGDGVAQCDGPEDCNNGQSKPYCCITLHLNGGSPDGGAGSNSGDTMCTANCNPSLGGSLQDATLTTRLCRTDTECAGLTITVGGFSAPSDHCCTPNANPMIHLCAPAPTSPSTPYTCP